MPGKPWSVEEIKTLKSHPFLTPGQLLRRKLIVNRPAYGIFRKRHRIALNRKREILQLQELPIEKQLRLTPMQKQVLETFIKENCAKRTCEEILEFWNASPAAHEYPKLSVGVVSKLRKDLGLSLSRQEFQRLPSVRTKAKQTRLETTEKQRLKRDETRIAQLLVQAAEVLKTPKVRAFVCGKCHNRWPDTKEFFPAVYRPSHGTLLIHACCAACYEERNALIARLRVIGKKEKAFQLEKERLFERRNALDHQARLDREKFWSEGARELQQVPRPIRRQCENCRKVLPKTTRYFAKHSGVRGWSHTCRVCTAEKRVVQARDQRVMSQQLRPKSSTKPAV